ncbi:MAG TPA: sigma-70 family RNA polymerase sigma factor [Bryobacteraceae bacterium]|nr:sigma-70 family RNA polymerase sigma factor [Bryobacteraceae bacterium]
MARQETELLLEHLFRHQAGRILAHLTRLLGPRYLEIAEEAVQEAMLRAMQTWPQQGAPENAPAWLFRVAHNAAIDAVRRERAGGLKSAEFVEALNRSAAETPGDPGFEEQLRDDELRLVFMCCHPGIPREARVVLSLKIAGGFNVREIARAFLAADEAIAQKLVRARRQIRDQQMTLEMPRGAELSERLDSVLEVIYFMFNEGYGAHEGEGLIRTDLCFEALRLGDLIAASSIAAPRVHALMALMALQAARLTARTDDAGDLILLEEQDRGRWDQRLTAAGFHHFELSIAGDDVSQYHAQAAIAAAHARGAGWPEVLDLYEQLYAITPSPVVALNRAVAIARVRGPAEALQSIESLELPGYYLYLAVRGHLLLELGARTDAGACFRAALECRCSEPERRFLQRKMAECAVAASGGGRG